MSVQLPTLSSSGWVSSIAEKLDRLVGYFIVSDASQTHVFKGNVASLPQLIQVNTGNDDGLKRNVQNSLSVLLSRYFDRAEVDVSLATPNVEDPNRQNITIDAVVIQDGVRYSVGREITLINSRVVEIFKINNG